ncbi:hypothetical protein N431DRAFT_452847 [Stipitochalara longipes BDJ]|nr:hypothetical protein N431DRAFT_452847 [Stipitochalara longipes BDJ]
MSSRVSGASTKGTNGHSKGKANGNTNGHSKKRKDSGAGSDSSSSGDGIPYQANAGWECCKVCINHISTKLNLLTSSSVAVAADGTKKLVNGDPKDQVLPMTNLCVQVMTAAIDVVDGVTIIMPLESGSHIATRGVKCAEAPLHQNSRRSQGMVVTRKFL